METHDIYRKWNQDDPHSNYFEAFHMAMTRMVKERGEALEYAEGLTFILDMEAYQNAAYPVFIMIFQGTMVRVRDEAVKLRRNS